MNRELTLVLTYTLVMAFAGCEKNTTSVVSGPFHVDLNTGLATGQALGITFEVFSATRAKSKDVLNAGKPEHTSARTKITLADDAVIDLEMLEGGSPISFKLNGTDFGTLKEGDHVVISEQRNVTVNGTTRGPLRTPSRPTAQSTVLPKYDGVILHTFPDGKRVRIDTPPASSGIFEGLSGEHIFTRPRGGTGRTELIFEFKLMAHRQGKDVYQITRTVTDYEESQTKGSAGRGRISKFSIEFDGTPITIGDDMHGVTRLMSRELATEGKSLEESVPVDDASVEDSENLGNEP